MRANPPPKAGRFPRVNLVGIDRILVERIRASLWRSPFCFLDSPDPLGQEEAELYVAPVDRAMEMLADRLSCRVPVIACGPAGLMRSAFLAGASDYLREPWQPEELGIRAAAVLERLTRRFVFPWGTMTLEGSSLALPGTSLRLTLSEAKILRTLLLSRGTPVSRQALGYVLWGTGGKPGSRVIDVHVSALRRRLGGAFPPCHRFIKAVRSQGYIVE